MDGFPEGVSSDSLRPGTALGRYEIRRLIGQGGMGCVYEAVHRDLKKRVAIKTLLPALASNADAKQRFLREGEAASRIRHAHVVDVTDVGAEGNVIYLVMEYLEGEDLARLIARQGFLTPQQTADIMLPVAAAIFTAHEQSVIHRDLKPENIFLARTGYGAVHPKVLDFGISKVLGDSRARALTGTAATMGTMNYLPPEQLRAAREADARSDQYGLGTILYECVTGQRAFEEESFYIVLKKIAEGDFPPPSSRRPGIPPHLEAVILRAMSLEPIDRFESVRQLGAALLAHASEHSNILWAPFFGQAPAVDVQPAARDVSSQARVPTMVARPPSSGSGRPPSSGSGRPPSPGSGRPPSSGSGVEGSSGPISGTMELPAPRKQASTTMRNATGEREIPITFNRPRRSRAPMVVAGVALVSAVAVLIVLRGGAGTGRREDPDQPGLEQWATPRSASPAPEPARREPPPPRYPDPETPLANPGHTARPALPARGETTTSPDEASASDADQQRPGNEGRPRKLAGKPGRKSGKIFRGKRPPANAGEAPAEEPEKVVPLPNQAPIIPL
ncbi:MAG TPA: serine/threonine-protein kinase [Polyangia bacterium]|jgi:serine/threonine-protein kinase|nr:serine/threonine-protein kinase [Polyangia bacterium]